MSRKFQLVDVFHDQPLSGNPLGVVLNGAGLSSDEMQRITRWLNLSETTFLLPPENPAADYRVRIFTLEREMPFAGHPTLGSCHAWLSNGGQPHNPAEVIQECGVGLVPVRPTQNRYAFAAPKLQRSGPLDESKIAEIAGFLRIERSEVVDAQWVDNGPGWAGVLLKSAEAVLALNPPKSSTTRIDYGVIGPYPPDSPQRFELRAFFSDQHGGILEDPVTGSLNASMAQWMIASGRAVAPYQASQGTRLDRAGRIDIMQDASGQIWIGGRATTLFSGDCLL